jgi:hypothetical protein
MTTDQWLPTPRAAAALDCSESFLKRSRDTAGGFLINGKHWRAGTSWNRPMLWNVPLIRALLNERGLQQTHKRELARKAERDLAKPQQEPW